MRLLYLMGVAVLAQTFAPVSLAREVTPAERRVLPYSSDLPLCGDPSVLANLSTNFAEKEAKFWNSDLTIVEYAKRPFGNLVWRIPLGREL